MKLIMAWLIPGIGVILMVYATWWTLQGRVETNKKSINSLTRGVNTLMDQSYRIEEKLGIQHPRPLPLRVDDE